MKPPIRYSIVIPARMTSQRLPGKPLLDIGGQSLLERVWRQAARSSATAVTIATDDQRILQAARAFGADAVMTSAGHESGSDRIAECIDQLELPDDAIVVNLQGDEPLMPPACLDQVAGLLANDSAAGFASLYWPIDDASEIADPNVVKVVLAHDNHALYFSRAVVPYLRDPGATEGIPGSGTAWNRHIGLYAYRAGALRDYARQAPGRLERFERLEQLRVLESGGRIAMAQACAPIPAGVDTPDDLERVRRVIINNTK